MDSIKTFALPAAALCFVSFALCLAADITGIRPHLDGWGRFFFRWGIYILILRWAVLRDTWVVDAFRRIWAPIRERLEEEGILKPRVLTPQQIAEKFIEAWQKLDPPPKSTKKIDQAVDQLRQVAGLAGD